MNVYSLSVNKSPTAAGEDCILALVLVYNYGLYYKAMEDNMSVPIQESVDAVSYPESQLQWLVSLLNLLAGIVNRNEDLSSVVVTETEYQQLSAVMDDLIYGVGDDENHPLSAAMTLVGSLIKAYEDEHFPKLIDLSLIHISEPTRPY